MTYLVSQRTGNVCVLTLGTSNLGEGYVPNPCYTSIIAQSLLSTPENKTRELVFEAIGGDV